LSSARDRLEAAEKFRAHVAGGGKIAFSRRSQCVIGEVDHETAREVDHDGLGHRAGIVNAGDGPLQEPQDNSQLLFQLIDVGSVGDAERLARASTELTTTP